AHFAGTVGISVVTPYGYSPDSPFTRYSYLAAVASVTSLDVSTGSTAGGTTVNLTGSGFTGASRVTFGGVPAQFTVNSDTSITAIAPAGTAGTVDATVTTPAGISSAVSGDHYTYNSTTPTVTALSLPSGPAAGGTSVNLTGANLNGATAISFGGTAATSFT